jgi:hypothetical protein
MNMVKRVLWGLVAFILCTLVLVRSSTAQKQEKKEAYTVGPGAIVTVTSDCGPITVRRSPTSKVLATMISHSPSVRFVNEQRGNRLELRATSPSPGMNLAEYIVLIPWTKMTTVRSANGNLYAQGLRGDVDLQTSTSTITVSDMDSAHLKARTLSGTINLKEVHRSHVDIYTVKGDIHLHNVGGSWLEAGSGSGKVTYDGDPGTEGEYRLFSHLGDLEVSIPSDATVEIKARSLKSDEEKRPAPVTPQNSFLDSRRRKVSRFTLRSFQGVIRVTRPDGSPTP